MPKGMPKMGHVMSTKREGHRDAAPSKIINTQTHRTTIIIPATLDLNLELCRIEFANRNGVVPSKNDLIKMALEEFITRQGRDPKVSPPV